MCISDNPNIVNDVLPVDEDLRANAAMIVVAAALVAGDGKVLLQQRKPDRSMAGLWEFPGGKVHDRETPTTALMRELEEELGIAVEAGALEPGPFATGEIDGRPLLLLLYLCRSWRGEPRPLDAAALAWLHPADMKPQEMPPADRPLVDWLVSITPASSR